MKFSLASDRSVEAALQINTHTYIKKKRGEREGGDGGGSDAERGKRKAARREGGREGSRKPPADNTNTVRFTQSAPDL